MVISEVVMVTKAKKGGYIENMQKPRIYADDDVLGNCIAGGNNESQLATYLRITQRKGESIGTGHRRKLSA